MILLLWSVGFFCFCGTLSLVLGHRSRWSNLIGSMGPALGGIAGLYPAVAVLWTGKTEALRCVWHVPYGSFFLEIDPLSAFFLLPLLFLSALGALYGHGYMESYRTERNLGAFWFFFNLLTASMTMLVLARNGILFLILWEMMSLSSFFLVTFENEKESVRRAGLFYLVATHLGTAFLFVLFLLLGHYAGASILDFDKFSAARDLIAPVGGAAFLLAVVGFGTKAGFMPFHVWLPEAHPAAPSHVSAIMSGVMIKTGIYGLLRVSSFLGPPAPWWGGLLLTVGLASGILGVLFAIAQHDLKKLLAFSSVENIGIISIGLGVGMLGLSANAPTLAVLGFAGGLFHVINHALFKGLLFFGAGSVLHATGIKDINRLGGLAKRMPWTATAFLVGAVAISGLPPLNGFVGEFLLYLGAFGCISDPSIGIAGVAAVIGLALIGGLAAACFTNAFGVVFLGEPRDARITGVHEAGWAMRLPMLLAAGACVCVGFGSPWILRAMEGVLAVTTRLPASEIHARIDYGAGSVSSVVAVAGVFVVLTLLIALGRKLLPARHMTEESGTWDCGYARPAASMQYTASSFAQPLTRMFSNLLRPVRKQDKVEGLFPSYAALSTETGDLFLIRGYLPIFKGIGWLLSKFRRLQEGRVQLYILYIALTIVTLLIWNLR